ncbi:hypothetical protein DRO21_05870 [archaeon]|nr:MAG: hypothetical protein DRO21_05870 [archaeon]
MVRRKGLFKREVKREEVWDLVKKLYLLMLFRWKEYYDTYNKLDPIISKYLGGHARDKWLHIISLAFLVGEDILKKVLNYCIEEYKKREEFSEIVRYTIYGILRALHLSLTTGSEEELRKYAIDELMDEVLIEREEKQMRLTSKAIIIANEGCYDGKDREHKSLVRRIGKLLKKAELEFVVDFSREGKKRTRFYTIDLQKLYDYLKGYEPELPEDVNYKLIEEEIGLDFESIGSKLSEFRNSVLELWKKENVYVQNGENMSATSETSAKEFIYKEGEKGEKESKKEEKIEKELGEIKEEFKKEEEGEKKLEADISDMADVFPEKHTNIYSIFGKEMAHKLSEVLEELKRREGMRLDRLLTSIQFKCGLDHIDRALEVVEKLRDEGIVEVEGDLYAKDKTEVRVRYCG